MTDEEQGTTTVEGRASIVGSSMSRLSTMAERRCWSGSAKSITASRWTPKPPTYCRQSSRMPPLKQTGARYYGYIRIDGAAGQSRPARQVGVGHGIALLLGAARWALL